MSKQNPTSTRKKQRTMPPLHVVIVGHVDHGKSTLIGRLLYDTQSLPEGKLEEIETICKSRGTDALEWSFVLDSFQAERDQAITLDTTQIWFSSDKRDYVIIDAPGHREFLKNMVSGASEADAAILVVDAMEGVQEQTRRHAYLLSLLGIQQIGVVINKMDMAGYDQAVFERVKDEVATYLTSIRLKADYIIPICAREGEGMLEASAQMPWYLGKNLIEALDKFEMVASPTQRPLRFPVQDVYRYGTQRIIVGRVESGTLTVGDTLLFSPLNESATVTSIEVWPDDKNKIKATAGEVIGITLDQPLFIERGHVGSHADNAPMLSNVFKARLFWLNNAPLKVGNSYKVRYGTCESKVVVQSIERIIDTQTLDHNLKAKALIRNHIGEVTLRARDLLPIDDYGEHVALGRVVLYDGYDIAGGGLVSMEGYPDQRRRAAPKSDHIYKVDHLLNTEKRAVNMGQRGGIFWFTGLSGAGKSTLAMAVEKALFDKGYKTYVLDGDNVRYGLNSDLGFSPEDRTENIRRIGHVAALMADAGMVVITAFISPYQMDRERAREISPDHYHEIYVQADLDTCESRDPKGLYKKARAGEILDFTGIDSPYEAPTNPEMVVDTQHHDIQTCLEQVVEYIENQIELSTQKSAVSNTPREKEFG